jgi:hypothetical protein
LKLVLCPGSLAPTLAGNASPARTFYVCRAVVFAKAGRSSHSLLTSALLPSPGVLLHVDGKSDRWRSEVMLMVRIDDPTRKEIPFAGFHLAQSWKPWHSLGVKAGCE